MHYQQILLNINRHGIAHLRLNVPDKHNAISAQMISELHSAANELDCATDVIAVILSGTGKSFCAGADLSWMQEQIIADDKKKFSEAQKLSNMLSAFYHLSKPVIGQIHGNVYGGGLGLVSICDIAIAADDTQFCFSETRLGLIPATIGPYVIARMGEAMARRVFMSARVFDAKEAKELNLIAKTVSPNQLATAIEYETKPYLLASAGAVQAAKSLLIKLASQIDAQAVKQSIHALVEIWKSKDAQIRVKRFLDKK
ncbi:MAG: enoyl-CoA hydratase-related protein [Pseudomonadota bacterium]